MKSFLIDHREAAEPLQRSLAETCALPGSPQKKMGMGDFCSAEDSAFPHPSPSSAHSMAPLFSCTELPTTSVSLPLSQALTLLCRTTLRSSKGIHLAPGSCCRLLLVLHFQTMVGKELSEICIWLLAVNT